MRSVLCANIAVLPSPDLLSQARKCQDDRCRTVAWLRTKRQAGESMSVLPQPIIEWGRLHFYWSAANKTVVDSHVCK